MYECFHCLTKSASHITDFDFADFGYEGEGIIHVCHCSNCGARITYEISIGDDEEDENYE